MIEPRTSHFFAEKLITSYIKGTLSYGVIFSVNLSQTCVDSIDFLDAG